MRMLWDEVTIGWGKVRRDGVHVSYCKGLWSGKRCGCHVVPQKDVKKGV